MPERAFELHWQASCGVFSATPRKHRDAFADPNAEAFDVATLSQPGNPATVIPCQARFWLTGCGQCLVTASANMTTKILLSPDPGAGGDPAHPSPPPGPPVSNPAPQPAPPPAATTVLEGTKTERELQLEEDNAKLAEEKRDRELRIMQLEDENHQLKSIPTIKTPAVPDDEVRWRPYKL